MKVNSRARRTKNFASPRIHTSEVKDLLLQRTHVPIATESSFFNLQCEYSILGSLGYGNFPTAQNGLALKDFDVAADGFPVD